MGPGVTALTDNPLNEGCLAARRKNFWEMCEWEHTDSTQKFQELGVLRAQRLNSYLFLSVINLASWDNEIIGRENRVVKSEEALWTIENLDGCRRLAQLNVFSSNEASLENYRAVTLNSARTNNISKDQCGQEARSLTASENIHEVANWNSQTVMGRAKDKSAATTQNAQENTIDSVGDWEGDQGAARRGPEHLASNPKITNQPYKKYKV